MKKALVRTAKPRFGFRPLSLRARLGGSFVMLALVAGVGFAGSRPAHTAGGPIPVSVGNVVQNSDVDNSDQQPFQITLQPDSGTSRVSDDSYVVPAGKRLVIEYYSAKRLL